MKYSQARYGRVFVIRLEDGDILHEEIEHLAFEESIKAAALVVLGGADEGSILAVGPENIYRGPSTPLELMLDNVYEITGTGTLFTNKKGKPILHMHIAAGRENETFTGCVRQGVRVWRVMEVVLFELLDCHAIRVRDSATGLELLEP